MSRKSHNDLRDELIRAALPHIPFDGWAVSTLEKAAADLGHSPAMASALFPGGVKDALNAFADFVDREMLKKLKPLKTADMRIRDRIKTAVMARFEILQQHREAERLALGYWALPHHAPRAAKIVWRTADRIWDWAGDTATDYNRYTKRGLLSGVLTASTLAWLNDDSANLNITEAFVGRRIENVMQLGGILGKIRNTKKAGA